MIHLIFISKKDSKVLPLNLTNQPIVWCPHKFSTQKQNISSIFKHGDIWHFGANFLLLWTLARIFPRSWRRLSCKYQIEFVVYQYLSNPMTAGLDSGIRHTEQYSAPLNGPILITLPTLDISLYQDNLIIDREWKIFGLYQIICLQVWNSEYNELITMDAAYRL